MHAAKTFGLWAYVLVASTAGCRQTSTQERTYESGADDARPVFIVWRFPGSPVPGVESRHGLVAAAWRDGRVVRSADGTSLTAYQTGRLSDDDRRVFLELLSGLPDTMKQQTRVVVDATSEHVYV